MRYATVSELKAIYSLFASRKDVFPYLRCDALQRRIEAGQCIYELGVALTFQKYRKRTRVGDREIPSGAVVVHQLINRTPFNGCGRRVFTRFFDEIVVPSGSDLFLTVRASNSVARAFYRRHGMKEWGKVAWAGGSIPGIIYKRDSKK